MLSAWECETVNLPLLRLANVFQQPIQFRSVGFSTVLYSTNSIYCKLRSVPCNKLSFLSVHTGYGM